MKDISNLSEIPKGDPFIIEGFAEPGSGYAEKLLKMGFVEGTVVQRAGVEISDPVILSLRHSRVALRKKEAAAVLVRRA